MDNELVASADRLKIGKSNLQLSSTLKSKEPTLQVVLDALKLTPFYNAFEISADVPEIYMQEFWVTVSRHHSSLRFKLNGKSHTVNVDNFRDMLKICPKLPGQKFEEPPLEEDILSFIRDLGHTGEIKFLSDVNVNHMHQPWRSFAAIINKCLSGKTMALESLRLSRAQILWGMYHNKKVDYVYLLWEDLVFQVENKNSKKNNDMDDFMFTTVRVISKHQDTQVYDAILPPHLTNQAMLESEAYMTYRAYATSEKTPKPKTTKKKADFEVSPKTKTTQATKEKRIKSSAKGDKAAKKKKPIETSMDKGLTELSDVALTEAKKLKLVIERSKTQTHNSHASGSGADEGTGVKPGVPDVPSYNSDDEQISWKSSDEEDDDEVSLNDDDDDVANQDDDNEQMDSDNEGDDFVHPKFSTHDDDAKQDEEVNKEESNEESDEEVQGANTEEEEMEDTAMIDAPLPNVQATHEIEDTHVILTALINPEGQQQSSSVTFGFVSNMLNPRPDTGIDLIFTLNTEATSLVHVPVTTIVEPPLVFATTLLPPPTPLITHMQQTPFPIPTTAPSTSLQDLPNFGSLFGFDHRLKTLETNFSEFKQTNQFAEAVSSIPGIVDAYLANKINDAVKTAVQLQSDRLRDEAQAENEDFLNKLDDNIKKIIKEQVKEQVKAQVSKILPKIKKTVNEQLEAETLVEAYESDKLILDTYGDTVSFKRRRDDEDKDKEPSTGSNRGSKRKRAGKEPKSTSAPKEKTSKTTGKSNDGSKSQHKSVGESAHTEEPMHTDKDLEEPAH
ncbi:hypothetical protein Tco_0109317 [Tanacetum coccineum]